MTNAQQELVSKLVNFDVKTIIELSSSKERAKSFPLPDDLSETLELSVFALYPNIREPFYAKMLEYS